MLPEDQDGFLHGLHDRRWVRLPPHLADLSASSCPSPRVFDAKFPRSSALCSSHPTFRGHRFRFSKSIDDFVHRVSLYNSQAPSERI
ncbi:hypothetical protein PMAYCL1PPCAC_07527 [Pristionchus mayeri]|uniref:Uncharacterized protein n=1 Tax=Pristionchus mayeri TaxID=1317129 RepID=A0AAN4ZC88_9BILA|nr:hypothetical protein PMAYCL1PPCAC_07510 [Pristionchus mayeri]GMR37332.1 hypothetical protein PMAYCL1PPCAC_07527 [Pristionchus mayeri]